MSREKLEEVGNKLSELKQWYRNDTEILEIFESVPYGISINIQEKIH
jgi:O-succinylbenzoate synthase